MNPIYVFVKVLSMGMIWGSLIWAILSYDKFLSGRLKDFVKWIICSIFFVASLITWLNYRGLASGQETGFVVNILGLLAGVFLILSVLVLDEMAETYGFGES